MDIDLLAVDGIASRGQLRNRGVTWRQLLTALEARTLVRVRRGVYATPDAPIELVAAISVGGVLAGPSAARLHGWEVLVRAEPWVAVPRDCSRRQRPGIRVLRLGLRPDEIDGATTDPVRTLVDCARRLPLREAVVILDSALRGGVSVRELAASIGATRGPGAALARQATSLADGRSESVIETCVRLIVLGLGLCVDMQLQAVIPGVGRVDFLIDGWLVIEADGFEFHRDRTSYREDRRRARALAAGGYVLLRFTYEDAVHHPDEVARCILTVLAQRPRLSRRAS